MNAHQPADRQDEDNIDVKDLDGEVLEKEEDDEF